MKKLLYTFEEWEKGEFSIEYNTNSSKLLGIENTIPVLRWNELSENEVELIKAEQIKIHKSKVDEGVEYFKNSFSQRSKKSKTPNNIVKNEIKALEKVIEFDSIVYKEPFHFDLEDFMVDSSRIKKIHKFILNLKRGIRLNTDYISIPTIVISNKWSNYNIVIAESIWLYYEWLLGKVKTEILQEEPEILKDSILSDNQKLILLYELGVIQYLSENKPFVSSTNELAKVIAKILSANETTIQSAINPMLREGVSQKNNPMKNVKNIEYVNSYLDKIGFKKNK
jgi:hypothetical protein